MTHEERYIARIIFKNKIFQYKGQQFEDFFVDIMTKYNINFRPIKAYGNIGDMKNDGFDKSTGTYYQVFAPDDIGKGKTIYDAVEKLETDFKGLYSQWNDICSIKHYYYVINDKYEGIAAPISQKVLKLDDEYADVEIDLFLAKDLENVFSELGSEDVYDVVGYFPVGVNTLVEYEALSETVKYLVNVNSPFGDGTGLVVPDFYEKIDFNDLSAVVNNLLVTGGYQDETLQKYFNNTPGVNEILQSKFTSLYNESKDGIPETEEKYADRRFFYILEKACVKPTNAIKNSVLVLMSRYFSTCDIFEDPDKK